MLLKSFCIFAAIFLTYGFIRTDKTKDIRDTGSARDARLRFVAIRRMAASLSKPEVNADVVQLRKDFEELKLDIEDILHDQNDINEATRAQLDAISAALAELQSKEPRQKPRRPISFVT